MERERESTLPPPYLSCKDRVTCNACSNSVTDHLVYVVRKEAALIKLGLARAAAAEWLLLKIWGQCQRTTSLLHQIMGYGGTRRGVLKLTIIKLLITKQPSLRGLHVTNLLLPCIYSPSYKGQKSLVCVN